MTGPRDWDKEMAEIDKVIERSSGVAGQRGVPDKPGGARPATRTEPSAPATRRSVALTWLWAALSVALALALLVWPYDKACGIRLAFYLGAAAMTAVVGLLGSAAAWSNRRVLAHVISLLVVAWAAVMAAREVLPRIGYAKEAATWSCPTPTTS